MKCLHEKAKCLPKFNDLKKIFPTFVLAIFNDQCTGESKKQQISLALVCCTACLF